ncbi:MAG: glycosyltransferase family 4 protein [Candidatus Helarchaeota archaeon]
MRKKKILHLIATNFYGGPEKQIIEHLVRLNKYNEFVGILGSFIENGQPNEILQKAQERNISHFGIPMNNPLDFKALLFLHEQIRSHRIDLLCAHHYKSVVMGYLVGRYWGIPVMDYSRGFTAEDWKVSFYEWLERLFVRRMDGIISVSGGQKVKLRKMGIRKPPIWVVHNGVDLPEGFNKDRTRIREDVFDELKIPLNSLMVVSAGRLSPEKGHRFLIDALSHIKEEIENTYFVFCGEGVCQPELENRAKKYGVLSHCRFPGFRKDMPRIYQAMDFLVLPSLTEGLPNVVLESFAYERPVVATAVGGVPEVVVDGENGWLVPSQDSMKLADAIRKMIQDPEGRERMGKAGREKVEREFTFEVQTPKLIEIYRKMFERQNRVA